MLYAALIKIIDLTGNLVTYCSLLDSDSKASFIGEDCLFTLCLEKNSSEAVIIFLGSYNAATSREVFSPFKYQCEILP